MDRPKKDVFPDWAKFLNPESLKGNLIAASLFLAAYESLCASVIDQIRGFYTHGFDEHGPIVDDAYGVKVLSRDKSPLRASLLWLKERDVVTEDDMAAFDDIRLHRNELAHNLPEFIMTAGKDINLRLLDRICELVTKIDRWWILEVEIPTDPDFDGEGVDTDGVLSMRMVFLQMMIQIAADKDSAVYWEQFQKLCGRST